MRGQVDIPDTILANIILLSRATHTYSSCSFEIVNVDKISKEPIKPFNGVLEIMRLSLRSKSLYILHFVRAFLKEFLLEHLKFSNILFRGTIASSHYDCNNIKGVYYKK